MKIPCHECGGRVPVESEGGPSECDDCGVKVYIVPPCVVVPVPLNLPPGMFDE